MTYVILANSKKQFISALITPFKCTVCVSLWSMVFYSQ